MNERIKELALLAGARICGGYVTPSAWSRTGGIDTAPIDLQKLVELIVRECATITWLGVDDANGTYGNELFVKLKEHFGVKE